MPVMPVERAPRSRIVAAGALAVCVAIASVATHFAGPVPAARIGPSRFGEGTRPRLEALRDRLAAGLVSLRLAAGDYPPRADASPFDPFARREATSMAVAGLGAARRMGAKVEGLSVALREAKDVLANRRKGTGSPISAVRPNRPAQVATVSAEILGLVYGGDPADASRLGRAATMLASDATAGPLTAVGWTRGIEVRAIEALVGVGMGPALGDDPMALVQTDGDHRIQDCGDPRVSEAFAEAVKAGGLVSGGFPATVLKSCADLKSIWTGDRTDLASWTLRAWLAARVEGGDRWFASMLPELEKAPEKGGVVPGDFYGDPVSRTACALLILWEGWEAPPAAAH